MPEQKFTQLKKCWGNQLISPGKDAGWGYSEISQSKNTDCALKKDVILPFPCGIPHTARKRNITRVEQYGTSTVLLT